jgi:mono/diheme cytochrome c family protein
MCKIEKAISVCHKAQLNRRAGPPRRTSTRWAWSLGLLPVALLLSGCRQDMHNQPRYEALEPSAFFNDGQASRKPVPNTVPRDALANDAYQLNLPAATASTAQPPTQPPLSTAGSSSAQNPGNNPAGGRTGQTSPNQNQANQGQPRDTAAATRFPFAITAEVLARGETQYNISCSPCHGRTGYGDGMVVRRGFPRPPSYHTEQLRNAANEHIYDVITNGFGRMWSYADQVEPRNRWAVAAYIRALQLSQNASLAEVPADKQSQLGQPQRGAPNQASSHPGSQPGSAAGGRQP